MNEKQAQDIINNSIQAHWPSWEFKGQELAVWIKELRRFDFETSKQAINDLYLSWKSDRYPKIAHIMAKIKENVQRKHEKGRMIALFGIFRKDGRRRWFDFWGWDNTPREIIEEHANRVCKYANDVIEPGHYIHYYSTEEKEDLGYYGEEGCSILVRRRQARDKAFKDILEGPETKTRRWLIKHLEKTSLSEDEFYKRPFVVGERLRQQCEPESISDAIDDIPF